MNAEERLAEAFALCRERMVKDGLDVETALASCPHLADALRPMLAFASDIAALGRIPHPSAAFRSRLAAELAAAPLPRTLQHPVAASPAPASPAAATDALVRALDDCLVRVRREGVEPAVALADYPELASELRPLLALAGDLRELDAAPAPSAPFQAQLAARLADAPRPRSLAQREPRGGSLVRRLWRNTAFSAAAAATVVLFLASGAIYASADARPGDWLYPVKRASEQARLWVAPDERAMWLHLGYADRRLAEAAASRAHAGALLAEFSREVTAALAAADESLADGAPRAEVGRPLVSWLIRARGRLVDGRPALPPTAWRGALALVDEAIRALAGDQLAVAPVPRLAASALVARAVEPGSRAPASPVERRSRRIAAAASPSPAAGPVEGPRVGAARAERIVYVIATAPAGGLAQVQVQASVVPSEDPPREPTSPPRRPTRPPSEPPTAPAPPTAPTTVPVPPTDTPRPTGVPSVDPSPAPTDTPAPPTAPPSPTATAVPVLNKPPVIARVWCDDTRLLLGKSTTCHVAAYDVEGDTLDYLWTSDVQQMLNERFKDATYFAAWGVGGGVMTVRITIYVSDRGAVADPTAEGVTRAETFVEVRPPDFFGP